MNTGLHTHCTARVELPTRDTWWDSPSRAPAKLILTRHGGTPEAALESAVLEVEALRDTCDEWLKTHRPDAPA